MYRYQRGGTEPPLDEVLCDPMIHLVMRRDGVDPIELLELIDAVRRGLREADELDESRLCA